MSHFILKIGNLNYSLKICESEIYIKFTSILQHIYNTSKFTTEAFYTTINFAYLKDFVSKSETWTQQGPEEERQPCLSGDPSDGTCKYSILLYCY